MPHCLVVLVVCVAGSIAHAKEAYCIAAGIYVGAEPSNDATWTSLRALRIRTVVGVDGLPPDQSAADAAGVRVVHVPIGYGAIPGDAVDQLRLVARDAPRPLYVYCHRGKHRGPAAAAIIGQAAGLLDREGAIDLLRSAGTDPAYKGLWQSVARFDATAPIPNSVRLSARSQVSPLRQAMGQLDRAWNTATSDGTSAEREAALVVARQALRESRRGAIAAAASESLMQDFDEALNRFEELAGTGSDRPRRFDEACIHCHQHYRD